MTLFRQLLLVIITLSLLTFVGTAAVNFSATRTFITEQLASHAQDTATSLGLSLSAPMQHDDRALMTSMVDAIFDRGYYEQIRIEDMAGHVLVDRRMPVRVQGVPGWFVRDVPLRVAPASALVMSGWHQAGRVTVWSHPGYAYRELWRSTTETAAWFILAAAVLALLGAVAVRLLMRPLEAVARQADQLVRRRYETQAHLPRTRELRSVVEAMNRLVGKVRSMFDEQAQAAEHWRRLAYVDALTGLANRRYFDAALHARLAEGAEAEHGSLVLVQIEGLHALNEQHGFEAGDRAVQRVAEAVGAQILGVENGVAARIAGADFALLLPTPDPAVAERAAEAIVERMAEESAFSVAVGIAPYAGGMAPAALLAEADQAVGCARAEGANRWHSASAPAAGELVAARGHWQGVIEEALAQERLELWVQPVVLAAQGVHALHHEVLLRLSAGGEICPAAVFMPFAEQLGLAPELDRHVVERIGRHAAAADGGVLALNLSRGALTDSRFLEWLFAYLERPGVVARRLAFEVPESLATAEPKAVGRLAEGVHRCGAAFGIDHFGGAFDDVSFLQELRPDYVKIAAIFTRELREEDRKIFVTSLCHTCHSLDILAIAEAVESEPQQRALIALGVDAVQGYLTGRPHQLDK